MAELRRGDAAAGGHIDLAVSGPVRRRRLALEEG